MSAPQKPYRMTHRNAVTGEIISVTEYPENAPILPALTANERGADRGWPDAALPDLPPAFEPVWPEYHSQGMGCGLEDRCITDRYDAMAFGWEEAVERCASEVYPDAVYTAEDVQAYARQASAAAVQAEREALLKDIPTTDGLMPDEVGGFLKGLLAYQLAIRARGTTDAVERVGAGVRASAAIVVEDGERAAFEDWADAAGFRHFRTRMFEAWKARAEIGLPLPTPASAERSE